MNFCFSHQPEGALHLISTQPHQFYAASYCDQYPKLVSKHYRKPFSLPENYKYMTQDNIFDVHFEANDTFFANIINTFATEQRNRKVGVARLGPNLR